MEAKLIEINGGKGIFLPDPILKQCHIDDDVDLEVRDNVIIIRPHHRKPRFDWDDAFESMRQNGDDALLIDDALDLEDWGT